MATEDDDGYVRRMGRDNPLAGLTPLQLSILEELFNRSEEEKQRPFYKRDETGQYDFGFKHGGKVHRGRPAIGSAEKAR